MITPHQFCIHDTTLVPCRPDCPACITESDAEYANRCERAAEGPGDEVVREIGCMVSKAEVFRDQVKAEIKAEAEEWEAWTA